MILEAVFEAWLRWRLETYRATPPVFNSVFVDGQHLGTPSFLGPGTLEDASKRWIPHLHAGGRVVLGETAFPVVDNGRSDLALDGDPSALWTPPLAPPRYTILSPDTARFQTWFTHNGLPLVVTTFAQIPDEFPCLTLRLKHDTQGETYVGEYVLPATITTTGVEVQLNMERVDGLYIVSIWTQNRDASLWLYALLRNMILGGMQEFASWGVEVKMLQGLDIDPDLGFLPQLPHARHLAVTLCRFEQAINLAQLDAIDRLRITPCLAYAPLWLTRAL